MWNPTIPQEKKFSTVTKLPGPCSSQSQRCRMQTLVDWFRRSGKCSEDPPAESLEFGRKTEEAEPKIIFSIS